jgi:alkyl hydroperoxide reductase subunit D
MNKLLDGISFNAFEKDLATNIKRVLTNESNVLSDEQNDAIILACLASTTRVDLIAFAKEYVHDTHGLDVMNASLGAASLMNMTNVYYSARATLQSVSSESPNMKMTFMKQHNVAPCDFELYALAVSAANGCKPCMVGHENALVHQGVSGVVVNESIRVAAVVKAFSKRVA